MTVPFAAAWGLGLFGLGLASCFVAVTISERGKFLVPALLYVLACLFGLVACYIVIGVRP